MRQDFCQWLYNINQEFYSIAISNLISKVYLWLKLQLCLTPHQNVLYSSVNDGAHAVTPWVLLSGAAL